MPGTGFLPHSFWPVTSFYFARAALMVHLSPFSFVLPILTHDSLTFFLCLFFFFATWGAFWTSSASLCISAHRFIGVLGVSFTVSTTFSSTPRTFALDSIAGNVLVVSGCSDLASDYVCRWALVPCIGTSSPYLVVISYFLIYFFPLGPSMFCATAVHKF